MNQRPLHEDPVHQAVVLEQAGAVGGLAHLVAQRLALPGRQGVGQRLHAFAGKPLVRGPLQQRLAPLEALLEPSDEPFFLTAQRRQPLRVGPGEQLPFPHQHVERLLLDGGKMLEEISDLRIPGGFHFISCSARTAQTWGQPACRRWRR